MKVLCKITLVCGVSKMRIERIEVKIKRCDLGEKVPEELWKRKYMALRKPCVEGVGEWNADGRRYNIRGLYSLVNTPEIIPIFDDGIKKDMAQYSLNPKAQQ